MKKVNNPPLLESDKQRKPLEGETTPDSARAKAAAFAAQEKARQQKYLGSAKKQPVVDL